MPRQTPVNRQPVRAHGSVPDQLAAPVLEWLERDYHMLLELAGRDEQLEDALRRTDEPGWGEKDDAELALEAQLPSALIEQFRAYAHLLSQFCDWRTRVAYAYGIGVGKRLAGGVR